jgi:hypothetical protein
LFFSVVQSLFGLERWGLSVELFQSAIDHNVPVDSCTEKMANYWYSGKGVAM